MQEVGVRGDGGAHHLRAGHAAVALPAHGAGGGGRGGGPRRRL
jgi:hypothetical protein